jgi:Cu2+-exporting ATPase
VADADVIALGDGRRIAATVELGDAVRPGALEACRRLRADGIALELLSGDAPAPVAALARDAGIDNWRARQDPAQKIARVRALQARGHRVAMLGDGINDAAVLAGADVSLAVAEGAALALAHADVVLHGGPAKLPALLAMARRTRRVMRQNLAWALAYNLSLVPAAALGMIPPWLAALGMSVSSLAVTLNALRLARVPADARARDPRAVVAGSAP